MVCGVDLKYSLEPTAHTPSSPWLVHLQKCLTLPTPAPVLPASAAVIGKESRWDVPGLPAGLRMQISQLSLLFRSQGA